LLSCGWQETNEPLPKGLSVGLKRTLPYAIQSKCEGKGLGSSACVLRGMARDHGLQDKIIVIGSIFHNNIWGDREDIARFLSILKIESFQDSTYKLLHLARVDMGSTFNLLPKEIMDMFIKAYFSSTYIKANLTK
jgi:hypothetical protein